MIHWKSGSIPSTTNYHDNEGMLKIHDIFAGTNVFPEEHSVYKTTGSPRSDYWQRYRQQLTTIREEKEPATRDEEKSLSSRC
jgi:hypothetical protein